MSKPQRCLGVLALVIALSVFRLSSIALAQINSLPREDTWVANGPVYAIARMADQVFIGGNFSYVAPSTGSGVPLDMVTGSALPAFPKVSRFIYACVSDGSGGWYIGGNFSRVGTFTRKRLAHIRSDYSVDPDWDPRVDPDISIDSDFHYVLALALSGSTLYVGGNFNTINGKTRNAVAALDTLTGNLKDWNPNPPSGARVNALAVSGNTVFAGGAFTSLGTESRSNIAAIDSETGYITSWNPGANSIVHTLAVAGSMLYAGGEFSFIGGRTHHSIAAIDISTGISSLWDPNPNNSVLTIAVSGSTVYAGGIFTSIGGKPRNSLAALDLSNATATDWNPNVINKGGIYPYVYAIAVSGSTVYAGGWFNGIGEKPRNYIAAIDAVTGVATDWDPGAGAQVFALAVSDTTVYAGGEFACMGGHVRNCIAALDAKTGAANNWNPDAGQAGVNEIRALAASDSIVYAGGSFTNIGGQPRKCLAALDAKTGTALDWKPDPNNPVDCLTLSGSVLYTGGIFTTISKANRNSIAALDVSTGDAIAWDPNADGLGYIPSVVTIMVSGSNIYVGGEFTHIGGSARNGIAALDSTGKATSWDPKPEDAIFGWPGINAFAALGSTIYVSGNFTNIGGEARYKIAALDAITGKATPWAPNLVVDYPFIEYPEVKALAASGSSIYVGGAYTEIGGKPRTCLAALDATTGAATYWNPNSGMSLVTTLMVSDSRLYISGYICDINGQDRFLAQFDPIAAADAWELYR